MAAVVGAGQSGHVLVERDVVVASKSCLPRRVVAPANACARPATARWERMIDRPRPGPAGGPAMTSPGRGFRRGGAPSNQPCEVAPGRAVISRPFRWEIDAFLRAIIATSPQLTFCRLGGLELDGDG